MNGGGRRKKGKRGIIMCVGSVWGRKRKRMIRIIA